LVAGKLAHRRRSAQALRARAELVEDLLVRIALADAGLKSCECLPVDPLDGSVGASTCHGNQNRAYSPGHNKILLSLSGAAEPRLRAVRLALELAVVRAAGRLSRLARRGGGTTLPGKLLARVDPGAVGALAAQLPLGSVLISATNGKTTTAAMAASILSPTARLARNAAGANLVSGVASTLVAAREAELGLFEVDEGALQEVAQPVSTREVST